jgi:superfamily I DNA/RNA helicase
MEPNPEQEKLINSLEGVYLVDAGAGTGKTFCLTRRYTNIIQEVYPEDVLLVTFTHNAADQMKERIMDRNPERASEIENAPIMTFHSLCRDILRKRGVDTPKILGMDQSIPSDIDIIESRVRELDEFERFFNEFQARHDEYSRIYRIIEQESELLELLKNISSKGVIPEEDGWFGKSEEYLDGDYDRFREIFKEQNQPRSSSRGKKQSRLREKLYSYNYKLLPDQSPDAETLRGDSGTKQVRMDYARKAFNEDREELKEFVHALYYEYLDYCLGRGYLNFSFLLVLAYTLLYSDHETREELEFDYVMIDEFQDTNEIQFKLSILLSGQPNFCAVGDWKQSIYGFQHASVENITRFEDRLERYSGDVNTGKVRSPFVKQDVERIELFRNYRSGQEILETADQALTAKASDRERLNTEEIMEDVVSLESEVDHDGETGKYLCESEPEVILGRIQELVEEGYGPGDIAILVRNRDTGFEIHDMARELGFPVVYEGGVRLFDSPPALMLLAWLRILQDDERGWATVLEWDDYSIAEVESFLETDEFPEQYLDFRARLERCENIGEIAALVFDRYEMWSPEADRVIDVLENTFEHSYIDFNRLTGFITDNIESGEIYEIEADDDTSSIRIQTIHGAKGLEYPVVFVAGLNRSVFPSTQSGYSCIDFEEPLGLRARKSFVEENYAYSFDNWRSEVLFKTLDGGYDEERRLFYVAMTRAEEKLYLTTTRDRESTFFTEIDVEEPETPGKPDEWSAGEENETKFETGEIREIPSTVSPSKEIEGTGRKSEKYHEFAERYVEESAEPGDEVEEKLADFLDSLEGGLRSEVEVVYPRDEDVIRGRIDLLVEDDDQVRIYDFKLKGSGFEDQIRAYHRAVEESMDKTVESFIYWLKDGETERVKIKKSPELEERV